MSKPSTLGQQRLSMIEARLQALNPLHLDIIDDSHLHEGHASAGGAGHFTVIIASEAFNGLSTIKRHQLIYKAVADMIPNEIHALSIKIKDS